MNLFDSCMYDLLSHQGLTKQILNMQPIGLDVCMLMHISYPLYSQEGSNSNTNIASQLQPASSMHYSSSFSLTIRPCCCAATKWLYAKYTHRHLVLNTPDNTTAVNSKTAGCCSWKHTIQSRSFICITMILTLTNTREFGELPSCTGIE